MLLSVAGFVVVCCCCLLLRKGNNFSTNRENSVENCQMLFYIRLKLIIIISFSLLLPLIELLLFSFSTPFAIIMVLFVVILLFLIIVNIFQVAVAFFIGLLSFTIKFNCCCCSLVSVLCLFLFITTLSLCFLINFHSIIEWISTNFHSFSHQTENLSLVAQLIFYDSTSLRSITIDNLFRIRIVYGKFYWSQQQQFGYNNKKIAINN